MRSRKRDDGSEPGTSQRSYAVLRHRDYRILFYATIVTSLGTQFQRTATTWQIYELTGDPFQMGLVGLARFFPLLIFGLAGGVVADRGDRRRTLLITQVLLLVSTGVLALTSATGTITPLIIYVVTALSATFAAVANPTRQALIPALVPRDELPGALSLNILASQVAMIAGPATAGIVIADAGVSWAYLVDTLSFVAVIVALLFVAARPIASANPTRGLTAIVEGLTFLRASPVLLSVMVVDFLATFFGAITFLMPVFAEEILSAGPRGLGVLLAMPAVGAVLGSLVMGWLPVPRRPGAGVLFAVTGYGICIFGFGMSTYFPLSLVFLAGAGAADAVSMALRHTVRNLATPDHLRGRIAAAHSTFAMGGPQLGEFQAGIVSSFIGVGRSVAIGGIAIVATVAVVAWRVPAMRRYALTDAIDGERASSASEPSTTQPPRIERPPVAPR